MFFHHDKWAGRALRSKQGIYFFSSYIQYGLWPQRHALLGRIHGQRTTWTLLILTASLRDSSTHTYTHLSKPHNSPNYRGKERISTHSDLPHREQETRGVLDKREFESWRNIDALLTAPKNFIWRWKRIEKNQKMTTTAHKQYNLKINKAILLREWEREREREEHKTRPGTPEKLSTLPHPNCGKTIRNWHSTNNGLNGHTGGGPNIRIWNSQKETILSSSSSSSSSHPWKKSGQTKKKKNKTHQEQT